MAKSTYYSMYGRTRLECKRPILPDPDRCKTMALSRRFGTANCPCRGSRRLSSHWPGCPSGAHSFRLPLERQASEPAVCDGDTFWMVCGRAN